MSVVVHRRSRGTTVVEIMMALALLAIGSSGIIAMQKVTIVANRDAKNLEIANEIARTWVERLRGDAMLWNHPSPLNPATDLADTIWLPNVKATTNVAWFRPSDTALSIYGVHDALGRDDPSGGKNGPYCVNLRLNWIRQDKSIRAEIRVYWLRKSIQSSGTSQAPSDPLCGDSASSPPDVQFQTEIYHFVQVATEIRQNTAM
jgi:type IV pilus assembly protein PilV